VELLPIIALFTITGLAAIADVVAQHVWVAATVAGAAYLALVRAEIRAARPVPAAVRPAEPRA